MNIKRISAWSLFIIAIGALVFFLYKYGAGEESTPVSTTLPEVRSTDMVQGKADAKVTLIEYADFQCPACAQFAPVIKQIQQDEGDKLRFVYRYFPLTQIHRHAMDSAEAAAAANLQGKFWEMHDLLFQKQTEWSTAPDASIFDSYAQQLGLDVNKFKSDMSSSAVQKAIQDSLDESNNIGLDSTPTFFLNGQKLDQNPASVKDFEQLIDAAAK